MKYNRIALAVASAGLLSMPVLSSAATTKSVAQQVKSLQQEVQVLKQQVRTMKYRPRHARRGKIVTQRGSKVGTQRVPIIGQMPYQATNYGSPVTGAPYYHRKGAYDGSDLFVNFSSVNKDLALLHYRQAENARWGKAGFAFPHHPIVRLSGAVEVHGVYTRPYANTGSTRAIDLNTAEITAFAEANPWVSGFMSLAYDNSPATAGTGPSYSNSRLYIDNGFVTVGNLAKSPFYGSAGQMFVPFGQYSSAMITDPLTKIFARTKARTAILGFEKAGFNASIFKFYGDTRMASGATINNFGGNLSYSLKHGDWSGMLGTSYIRNITDSQGFQSGIGLSANTTDFPGLSTLNSGAYDRISQRVAGYDVRGGLGYSNFSMNAEWVGAGRMSTNDMTFNGHGAKISALNVEAGYAFSVMQKPTSFTVGYGQTWEGMPMGLPQYRAIANVSTSLWRDTVEAIEYRHDINYSNSNTANYGTGSGTTTTVLPNGDHSDAVILKLAMYF